MSREKPDPFQKLARSLIRGFIDEVINKNPPKASSPKSKSKKKSKSKRSRYIPPSVRVTVLKRDNFKCVFCGRSSKQIELQVDHIYPFSKGGSNDIDNLQTLCVDCNLGKSDRIF